MARELGMNPKKFGKLDNHEQEPWKAPLPQFIERIYFKSFGKHKPEVVRSMEQIAKDENKQKEERKKQAKERKEEERKKQAEERREEAKLVVKEEDAIAVQSSSLIESILKIPGKKILTLAMEGRPPFVIDVSEEGVFGYEEGHESLFRAKLFSALNSAAGLIVRQFLPIKVEREMPDGRRLWIPRKNIYGIQIASGKWTPLPKSEVESACGTDCRTENPIPLEEDVSFCELPMPSRT
jgi:hypothetical protein